MIFRQQRFLALLLQVAGIIYFGSQGNVWVTATFAWCLGSNMSHIARLCEREETA